MTHTFQYNDLLHLARVTCAWPAAEAITAASNIRKTNIHRFSLCLGAQGSQYLGYNDLQLNLNANSSDFSTPPRVAARWHWGLSGFRALCQQSNVTGNVDDSLQSALGWPKDQSSDNITLKLLEDCFL